MKIAQLIEKKGLTQVQAAERMGLDQPKVSRLLRGKLSGFSADRLLTILNRLGHSVEVRISLKGKISREVSHSCNDRIGSLRLIHKPAQLHADREADRDEGGDEGGEAGAHQGKGTPMTGEMPSAMPMLMKI